MRKSKDYSYLISLNYANHRNMPFTETKLCKSQHAKPQNMQIKLPLRIKEKWKRQNQCISDDLHLFSTEDKPLLRRRDAFLLFHSLLNPLHLKQQTIPFNKH